MDQRSPVHEIVNALWRALHQLGGAAETTDVERWGFSIDAALSAAGREFHKLSTNTVEGETLASMAVSAGSIFIRTDTHLYRIRAATE